jgi:hypothetical protein
LAENAAGRHRRACSTTRCARAAARSSSACPDEIIDKVRVHYSIFRHDRFMAQIGIGTLPHEHIMRAIELLGTVVAPTIRRETT